MSTGVASAAERRRQPRYRLEERARLRPNEWSTVQAELLDISSTGFRACCDANLKIGGYVTLEINGIGPAEARIVWRHEDMVGAQFLRPIKLDYCAWVRVPVETVQDPDDPETLMEMLRRRAIRIAAERVANDHLPPRQSFGTSTLEDDLY